MSQHSLILKDSYWYVYVTLVSLLYQYWGRCAIGYISFSDHWHTMDVSTDTTAETRAWYDCVVDIESEITL